MNQSLVIGSFITTPTLASVVGASIIGCGALSLGTIMATCALGMAIIAIPQFFIHVCIEECFPADDFWNIFSHCVTFICSIIFGVAIGAAILGGCANPITAMVFAGIGICLFLGLAGCLLGLLISSIFSEPQESLSKSSSAL